MLARADLAASSAGTAASKAMEASFSSLAIIIPSASSCFFFSPAALALMAASSDLTVIS
jgi:hypothetical protein